MRKTREPGTIQTTVRLTDTMHEELRVAVARRRLPSVQQAITTALEQWIEEGTDTLRASADTVEQVKSMARISGVRVDAFLQAAIAAMKRRGKVVVPDALTDAEQRYARYAVDLVRASEENPEDYGIKMALHGLDTVGPQFARQAEKTGRRAS